MLRLYAAEQKKEAEEREQHLQQVPAYAGSRRQEASVSGS